MSYVTNKPLSDIDIGEGVDADLLRIARERYAEGIEFERDNRQEARDDLEFLSGDGQWEEGIREARRADSRPMLTINRMPQFVRQVANDMRQNRPAVKVRPVDDDADVDTADLLSGLIRHIEQASDAQSVWAKAADNQAACGMGHFRIATEYSDDDTFEQDIRLRRINDAFSVTYDPAAKQPCKEDGLFTFVEQSVALETFKAMYPEASTHGWDRRDDQPELGDWWSQDSVRIAEYWVKVPEKRTLALFEDGKTVDVTGQEIVSVTDEAGGQQRVLVDSETGEQLRVIRERTLERYTVRVWIINGIEVLEGPYEWPGTYIPIVPVIGEEVNIGERIIRYGVIRHAKDAQRMYNYWRSAQTEQIALQPKAPWTVTASMIAGYEDVWKQANTRNFPYLPFNPDPEIPGATPKREAPPLGSPAMAQEVMIAAEDMKATTGIYDAGLGQRTNETSGVAIHARQQESDVSTFAYIDHLMVAIRHAGRILVDLIPHVYDTARIVRILNEDDTTDFAELNIVLRDPDTGEVSLRKNDLSRGKYDVVVTSGPSHASKRQEAVEMLTRIMQVNPAASNLLMDILARNLDLPGAEEISERFRKMLPPGVAESDEDEEQEQPTPEMLMNEQQMQLDRAETEADIAKTKAGIAKTQAEIEKLNAQTADTEADAMTKALELMQQSGQMEAMMRRAAAMGAMDLYREITGGEATVIPRQ